jgi:hypothetical protein
MQSTEQTKPDAKPLARLILDTRKYKRIAGFMAATLCLTTLASYLLLIHPALLPADVTNPAVLKFMSSDKYKQSTEQVFQRLVAYNQRSDETADIPYDLLVVDPSQLGVVVTISLRLIPHESISPFAVNRNGAQQFKYETTMKVQPSIPGLILFCLLEAFLVTVAIYIFTHKPQNHELAWEEEILRNYFFSDEPDASGNDWPGHTAALNVILPGFHRFCLQLNHRYGTRPGFQIIDEHDVQDVLHALLRLHFRDVRAEEPTPSHGGSWTRMDFLLQGTGIVIETKMARPGHADKQIAEELILDIAHYAAHPKCEHLICFIYDPMNSINNAAALQDDIPRNAGRLRVNVIFSPAQ